MTRQQIIAKAMGICHEDPSAGDLDYIQYNGYVDDETNELARAMDAFYLQYATNLVEGQQAYCPAFVYKIKAVVATMPDGSFRPLVSTTPNLLDETIGSYWRNVPGSGPAQGYPSAYIVRGLNSIWLTPAPNYSLGSGASGTAVLSSGAIVSITPALQGQGYVNVPQVTITDTTGSGAIATANLTNGQISSYTIINSGANYTNPTITISTNGLIIEGFGVPTDGGTSLWANPTDQCPLPYRDHSIVAIGTALRRMSDNPTPDNMARYQMQSKLYRRARGLFEREVYQYSPATQYRESSSTHYRNTCSLLNGYASW